MRRLKYYRRILAAYLLPGKSQLAFWHESPEINPNWTAGELGEYPMTFLAKADYEGPFDPSGVPLLDYRGALGRQHNPIAVAQYGLGNYNLWRRTGDPGRRRKSLAMADWLVDRLETNPAGLAVWNHHFDWEYRTPLKAPWYSGLAQGQGISLLMRAHRETGAEVYRQSARRAFESFTRGVEEGGVVFRDENGDPWFEEYIVSPPTHILNGFIWASWGVYDYAHATGDATARDLFDGGVRTIARNLHRYDAGYWSLYEQSGTRLRMLASPFYHRLHIVQLRILHRMTGEKVFEEHAARWEEYLRGRVNRFRAFVGKSLFKLCYY